MNEQLRQIPASETRKPGRWEQAFNKLPPNLRNVVYVGALSVLLVACGGKIESAESPLPTPVEFNTGIKIEALTVPLTDFNKTPIADPSKTRFLQMTVSCEGGKIVNTADGPKDVTDWQRKTSQDRTGAYDIWPPGEVLDVNNTNAISGVSADDFKKDYAAVEVTVNGEVVKSLDPDFKSLNGVVKTILTRDNIPVGDSVIACRYTIKGEDDKKKPVVVNKETPYTRTPDNFEFRKPAS